MHSNTYITLFLDIYCFPISISTCSLSFTMSRCFERQILHALCDWPAFAYALHLTVMLYHYFTGLMCSAPHTNNAHQCSCCCSARFKHPCYTVAVHSRSLQSKVYLSPCCTLDPHYAGSYMLLLNMLVGVPWENHTYSQVGNIRQLSN